MAVVSVVRCDAGSYRSPRHDSLYMRCRWIAHAVSAQLAVFELAQELRNVGLADRPSLFDVIAVEAVSDRAATRVGRFQHNPELSFADMDGLAR